MIYLFEDRKGRMKKSAIDSINDGLLLEVIFDCSKDQIESYIDKYFINADVILFHRSYTFPQTGISSDDVKIQFLKRRIPFVYFSGGLNNNILIENGITNANVNSGDMYNNLNIFIHDYKEKSIPNIPLLVFGEEYLINSLLELQYLINVYFFDKSKDYKFTNDDYDNIIDYIIIPRIKEEEIKKDKARLVEWLNKTRNENGIIVETVLTQIQKLINKY